MTFHHHGDEKNSEWGFSFVKLDREKGDQTEIVPTIRFNTWMKTHMQNRIIPEKPNVHDDAFSPTVMLKFDMEGAEYDVLMDLFFSGVFCETVDYVFGAVDYVFGEIHSWVNANLLEQVVNAFNQQKEGLYKSKSIDWMDNESYLWNRIPLPEIAE